MKKTLLLTIFVCFFLGFSQPVRPVSSKAKIGIGAAALVAGGVGLWYYLKKLNEECECKENKGKKAGAGMSAVAALAGAGLLGKGVYDYVQEQNQEPEPAGPRFRPSAENVLVGHGMQQMQVDFFRTVLGVDEQTFRNLSLEEKRQAAQTLEQQGVSFGQFNTFSLNQLQQQTDNMPAFEGRHQFRRIVHPQTDIKRLQTSPQNNGAVFQVASNFNGLEAGDYVGSNNLINPLQHIRAQGEQASMSAFPGIVCRRYLHGPVNFLDELVRQNVVRMDRNSVRVTRIPNTKNLLNHEGDIKIGYHANVSVTHGIVFRNIVNQGQVIDQVFVAALDTRQATRLEGDRALNSTRLGFRRSMTTCFLRAAYEGTVRVAFLHGKRRVFLTLVGGGVFNNTLSEIGEALIPALRFAREKNMHITLVCRMDRNDLTQEQQVFFNNLRRALRD